MRVDGLPLPLTMNTWNRPAPAEFAAEGGGGLASMLLRTCSESVREQAPSGSSADHLIFASCALAY